MSDENKQEEQQHRKLSEGMEAKGLGNSIYDLLPKQEFDIIKKGLEASSLPIENLKPIEQIPQNNIKENNE